MKNQIYLFSLSNMKFNVDPIDRFRKVPHTNPLIHIYKDGELLEWTNWHKPDDTISSLVVDDKVLKVITNSKTKQAQALLKSLTIE